MNPTERVFKSRSFLSAPIFFLAMTALANAQSVVAHAAPPRPNAPVVEETKSARIAKIAHAPNFEAMLAMDGAEPE